MTEEKEKILIHPRLKNEDFRLIKVKGKIPVDTKWQSLTEGHNYAYFDEAITKWVDEGNNYGVVCGSGNLVVLDCDTKLLYDIAKAHLPDTFTVETSIKEKETGWRGKHLYFITELPQGKIVIDKDNVHLGELQGLGAQVVAPNSIHASGIRYQALNDLPIFHLSDSDLKNFLSLFSKGDEEFYEAPEKKNRLEIHIPITKLLDMSSFKKIKDGIYCGKHPIHDSETGGNFNVNVKENTWWCFRHSKYDEAKQKHLRAKGGRLELIGMKEGLIKCEDCLDNNPLKDKELFIRVVDLANKKYGARIELKKAELIFDEIPLTLFKKVTEFTNCPAEYLEFSHELSHLVIEHHGVPLKKIPLKKIEDVASLERELNSLPLRVDETTYVIYKSLFIDNAGRVTVMCLPEKVVQDTLKEVKVSIINTPADLIISKDGINIASKKKRYIGDYTQFKRFIDSLGYTYNEPQLLEAYSQLPPSAPTEVNEENSDIDIVEFARGITSQFFKDQYDEPMCSCYIDDKNVLVPLEDTEFKRHLSGSLYNATLTTPSITSINSAILTLGSMCREKIPLHVRKGLYSEGTIILDLCNENGEYVKITKDGWSINSDPMIFFRRFPHQKPLPTPVRGEYTILDMLKLIPFENEQSESEGKLQSSADDAKLLYKCAVIANLIPDIPLPILEIYGCRGSAKSTTSKMEKVLFDDSATLTHPLPEDESDFARIGSRHSIVIFDNLSYISPVQSDFICKGVTGTSFSARRLYTNDEEKICSFKTAIRLNGINVPSDKPDLKERCISVELTKPAQTIEEDKLWTNFEKMRPSILAYCLDIIVQAMRIKETLVMEYKPRMADFAVWGEAIARACGEPENNFIKAYRRLLNNQDLTVVESDIVGVLVLKYLSGEHEGCNALGITTSPEGLFSELERVAAAYKIPINYKGGISERTLTKRLNLLKNSLWQIGVEVQFTRTHKGRQVTLRWRDNHSKSLMNDISTDKIPNCEDISKEEYQNTLEID